MTDSYFNHDDFYAHIGMLDKEVRRLGRMPLFHDRLLEAIATERHLWREHLIQKNFADRFFVSVNKTDMAEMSANIENMKRDIRILYYDRGGELKANQQRYLKLGQRLIAMENLAQGFIYVGEIFDEIHKPLLKHDRSIGDCFKIRNARRVLKNFMQLAKMMNEVYFKMPPDVYQRFLNRMLYKEKIAPLPFPRTHTADSEKPLKQTGASVPAAKQTAPAR